MMNWIRKRLESATLSLQLSSIRSTRRMAFSCTAGKHGNGRVINVQRAKKKGEPAVLDVQFTSLSLPNGRQRAINGSLTDLETSTGTVITKDR
jgi:hypothetical protein